MRSSTGRPVSLRNRLLSGGVWATGGKAAAAASAVGVNALLARLLRPEELGAYFLTLSLVSITATIAGLGLSRTVVRLVAESVGREEPGRARGAVRRCSRTWRWGGRIGALRGTCKQARATGANRALWMVDECIPSSSGSPIDEWVHGH